MKESGIMFRLTQIGVILLFIVLLGFGCSHYPSIEKNKDVELTNQQVIEMTKYCESNGLRADTQYGNGFADAPIINIRCLPK